MEFALLQELIYVLTTPGPMLYQDSMRYYYCQRTLLACSFISCVIDK